MSDNRVRVDFFKPSGKWYCTESVEMTVHEKSADHPLGWDVHYALAHALDRHLPREEKRGNGRRLSSMIAVCLEPRHVYAHPAALAVGAIEAHLRGEGVHLARFLVDWDDGA